MRPVELRELLLITITVRPIVDLGGGRRYVAFDGGTFEGRDGLAGTVLEGGVDWQRVRPDGVLEIDAHYTLQTETNEAIEVVSQGVRKASASVTARLTQGDQVDPGEYYFRTLVRLSTAAPRLNWLNDLIAVSTGDRPHPRARGLVSAASRGPRGAVIGAGIGGLATALSLHEVGVQVDVFDSSPELRPLGVGINLLPHAVRELDALGLLDALLSLGVAPSALVYCTKRGQEIWREPRGVAAGYPWPQLSVHRGMLQEVLRRAVVERLGADALHLGRRLVRVSGSDERPLAEFADGEVEADFIVAADGIHSAVRAQRYPEEGHFLWNGSLLWRGIAEVEPVLDGRSMIWAGHPEQKFVGYPIADLPGGRQRFNFIAELKRPDSDLGRAEDWNRQGSLDDFLPQFKEWDFGWLDVPAIVEAAPETFLFPMVDREPIPRWTFGRTTLLGDAAHPMYPIGSNGASQAILDARVLAGCIRRHDGTLSAALHHYEETRRPATAAIVRANRGFGPELPMKLVEERVPDGFADIADVITTEEIAEVTEKYRTTAGFSLAALQRRTSFIDDPYPL